MAGFVRWGDSGEAAGNRKARQGTLGGLVGLRVGKAADLKPEIRATGVGSVAWRPGVPTGWGLSLGVHLRSSFPADVNSYGASAFGRLRRSRAAHSQTGSGARHSRAPQESKENLRRLRVALLVRPQWFHLNRAEGES